MSGARPSRSNKNVKRKTPRDRGAARREKATARQAPDHQTSTPSRDAAHAWRQGISATTATTVDHLTTHMQRVVLDQLEQHRGFPPFVITTNRDGDYDLESLPPDQIVTMTPEDVLDTLREQVKGTATQLLGAVLAFPATLPDRSAAAAVVAEIEHVDGVQLTVIQPYRIKGVHGAKKTYLEDAIVERRDTTTLL